jgi:hypothetical protein
MRRRLVFVEGAVASSLVLAGPAAGQVTRVSVATGGAGPSFSTLVESDGPPIVVERAVHTTVEGVVWSAGTAALGTPLP